MKKISQTALLLITVLISGTSHAQDAIKPIQPVARTPFHLATTDNADRLVADWQKPGGGAHLKVTDKILRGKQITTFAFIGGCKTDNKNKCSITADMQVITPAGKPTMEQTGVIILDGPPPPRGQMIMSPVEVTLVFDKDDQAGEYKLQYHITDNNARATYDLETKITLLDKE